MPKRSTLRQSLVHRCRLACHAGLGTVLLLASFHAVAEVTVSSSRVPGFATLEERTDVLLVRPDEAADPGLLLINGSPVDPDLFPGVFRMTTGGTCTAAIVGPAAVLIAAHCVADLGRMSFAFDGGRRIDAICEHAPGYDQATNPSEDWALCLLEYEVGGFPYESVDTAAIPAAGTRIILSGYGCTEQFGPAGTVLRLGISTAWERPAGLPKESSTLYTRSNLGAGEAVLCPGDSGGPAWTMAAGADLTSPRSIVGVNSRTTFQHGYSLLAATASEAGKAFFDAWVATHGQQICGVNRTNGCM